MLEKSTLDWFTIDPLAAAASGGSNPRLRRGAHLNGQEERPRLRRLGEWSFRCFGSGRGLDVTLLGPQRHQQSAGRTKPRMATLGTIAQRDGGDDPDEFFGGDSTAQYK